MKVSAGEDGIVKLLRLCGNGRPRPFGGAELRGVSAQSKHQRVIDR